jgi:integrase
MILATTALRISEVAGLQVGDVDLSHGLLTVRRQTYPGRGGLITKETKGRRRRPARSSSRCAQRWID